METPPPTRRPFFSAAAEEGNKCVVCKSTHVGISTGMAFYAGHHTIRSWKTVPFGHKAFNLGATMFFLALGGWHAQDLVGLWKELREKDETVLRFAKRQVVIFLARHGVVKKTA